MTIGFSRQKYLSGLPFSPPGDLPDPRIEPTYPASLAFQADSLSLAPPRKPCLKGCCCVASVMSDPVQPHRRQPTRLPPPWNSPGKNTGVVCHFLLQRMKVKSEVAQSCLTLSDPMDCSLSGSSIHGIFQARVLEWGQCLLWFKGQVDLNQESGMNLYTLLYIK